MATGTATTLRLCSPSSNAKAMALFSVSRAHISSTIYVCTVTPSLSTFYVQQRTLPTRNPRFDCSATSGAGFACQRCRIQSAGWTGNDPSCKTHCRIAGKTSCWQHVVQSARPQFTSAGLQAALCPLLSSIPRWPERFSPLAQSCPPRVRRGYLEPPQIPA